AITLRREENPIIATLDHFGKVRIELYHRATTHKLRAAEILEPVLRTLHAMEQALGSVRKWHHSVLHTRGEFTRGEFAIDLDIAIEHAGKVCGVFRSGDDASVVGGIGVDAYVSVRCANHAKSLV